MEVPWNEAHPETERLAVGRAAPQDLWAASRHQTDNHHESGAAGNSAAEAQGAATGKETENQTKRLPAPLASHAHGAASWNETEYETERVSAPLAS